MNNDFYTYIYLDPRKPGKYVYGDYVFDYEPFYVGKGKGKQYLVHLQASKSRDVPYKSELNKHKFYKIKNILIEKSEPYIYKISENLSEQKSFELEIWLIWAIGRSDLKLGPLTNLTDGGEGSSNWNDIRKNNMRKWMMENNPLKDPEKRKLANLKRIGTRHSEESKKKMSCSHKGKILSSDTKNKMSNSHKTENFINLIKKIQTGRKASEKTKTLLKSIKFGAKQKSTFKVTFPDGNVKIINNIADFCRKHEISAALASYYCKLNKPDKNGFLFQRIN